MKTIKRIIMAIFIAASMGAVSGYSTMAVAAESAEGVKVGLENTIEQIEIAIAELEKEAADLDLAKKAIYEARQFAKEITGDNVGAAKRRMTKDLKKASRAAKKGEREEALSYAQAAHDIALTEITPNML